MTDSYPLSPVQHGILFHSLTHHGSEVYINQVVGRVREDIDLGAFGAAWTNVVRRHAMLRTAFEWQHLGEPRQREAEDVPFSFEFGNWPELSADQASARLGEFLADDRRRGLDLRRAPVMRVTIIRQGSRPSQFVWTSHHSVVDGRARIVVLREVAQLYEAFCEGREPALTAPRSYRAFVEWVIDQDLGPAEKYWRRRLEGLGPRAAVQLPRRRAPAAAGPLFGTHHVPCRPHVRTSVSALARESGTTVNTIVQAAWAVLLGRYTGQEDVVFGATRACRRIPVNGASDIVGVLVNTLPVRVHLDPDAPARSVLERLRAQNVAARPHEQTPLIGIHEWSGLPASAQLFDAVTVFENADLKTTLLEQARGLPIADVTRHGFTHYPLTLLGSGAPELTLQIDYDRRVHDDDAIEQMTGHLAELLEGMTSSPDRPPWRLPLTRCSGHGEPDARHGARTVRPDECLVQRIEAQVARTPDARAVSWRDGSIAYAELNARANRLARYLRRRGLGAEDTVGVCLQRSPELLVALLGIMKAGGAYVPLDPAYPSERVSFMLHDARVRLLLTEQGIGQRVGSDLVESICLDDRGVGRAISAEAAGNVPSITEPERLAYVIYTSGSTGSPKGVAVEHRHAAAFLAWAVESFRDDLAAVLAGTSICFDLSVFELFAPLIAGGTVVLVDNVLSLAREAHAAAVTLLNSVPSAIQELLRYTALPASVRTVCLAGEPLPGSLVRQIHERHTVRRVVNLYGPSETTTYSTSAELERQGDGPPPIGRPIAGTQVYVLDRHGELVPIGVPGELYIAGAGVARGYLSRPELTVERFLPNPFDADGGGRLYRTGDLVRCRPDGNLEFLGRLDQQVKIRGFRIEPGEIEGALTRHPALHQAVVVVDGTASDRELVAYVELREGEDVSDTALIQFLRRTLPAHMIPQFVVPIDEWPRTPNGKIDRNALVKRRLQRSRRHVHVAPQSPIEALVASVFARTLGTLVGMHDDFVALGGHSLLAMELTSTLSDYLQVDLPLNAPFEAPTVAQMVKLVEAHECAPGQSARLAEIILKATGAREQQP